MKNISATFDSYIQYYQANPNAKLTLEVLLPSLWGAFSKAEDIDVSDAIGKMKEDFELITLYLQEQHKRLYVDRKHSEGMRDSEMEIGPKTYNVYEAAMEMGCTQEAIRKAIRDGRLRAFVPKGQKTI